MSNITTPVKSETEIPATVPVQSYDSDGETVEYKFIPIDANYRGGIPAGYELVELPTGVVDDDAMTLYGFNEMFPIAGIVYGFLRYV